MSRESSWCVRLLPDTGTFLKESIGIYLRLSPPVYFPGERFSECQMWSNLVRLQEGFPWLGQLSGQSWWHIFSIFCECILDFQPSTVSQVSPPIHQRQFCSPRTPYTPPLLNTLSMVSPPLEWPTCLSRVPQSSESARGSSHLCFLTRPAGCCHGP